MAYSIDAAGSAIPSDELTTRSFIALQNAINQYNARFTKAAFVSPDGKIGSETYSAFVMAWAALRSKNPSTPPGPGSIHELAAGADKYRDGLEDALGGSTWLWILGGLGAVGAGIGVWLWFRKRK